MKAECGNTGCTREAELERHWEFAGQVVLQIRCVPCAEMHAHRAEFRPIEGREAEVA